MNSNTVALRRVIGTDEIMCLSRGIVWTQDSEAAVDELQSKSLTKDFVLGRGRATILDGFHGAHLLSSIQILFILVERTRFSASLYLHYETHELFRNSMFSLNQKHVERGLCSCMLL
jgi:hypothetical protein